MDIQKVIFDNNAALSNIEREKLALLDRLAVIDKEIIHYRGVISAFEYAFANTPTPVDSARRPKKK